MCEYHLFVMQVVWNFSFLQQSKWSVHGTRFCVCRRIPLWLRRWTWEGWRRWWLVWRIQVSGRHGNCSVSSSGCQRKKASSSLGESEWWKCSPDSYRGRQLGLKAEKLCRNCANSSFYELCVVVLSAIFTPQECFCCLEFQLHRVQPCWFRAEKAGWWCLRHSCHTVALFMMSLTPTARHAMAAVTAVPLELSDIDF